MSTAGASTIGIVGASGFIGSALTARCVAAGVPVVAASRSGRAHGDGVQALRLDLLGEVGPIRDALRDCDVIYYLVHSIDEPDFQSRDRRAAENFVAALDDSEAKVVVVGGLGHGQLSKQLESRHEVGALLRQHRDTVELRAPMVIGRGSLSFEILLTVLSKWGVLSSSTTKSNCQPIALDDALWCVEAARQLPAGVYEIGGADVLTYRALAERCAHVLGKRLWLLPVPSRFLDLSARLIAVALDIPPSYATALLESLRTDMTVQDTRFRELTGFEPVGVGEALQRALVRHDPGTAAHDAPVAPASPRSADRPPPSRRRRRASG